MNGLLVAVAFLLFPIQTAPNRPSVNFFSLEQDSEIGAESSREAEKSVAILKDPALNSYLRSLGQRLSRHSPLPLLKYRFRIVNSESINAFAFPGGYIYITTGLIVATANEAELAAVLAHEIGHVSARHGTAQLSRQLLVQAPISIAEGLLSDGGWKDQLAKLGISLGPGASFLRQSPDEELQADLLAVKILADTGFDPRATLTFIEKLREAETNEENVPPEFLFNHPQPEHWQLKVGSEIDRGVPLRRAASDSEEFRSFRAAVRKAPPARIEKRPQVETPTETAVTVYTHPKDYFTLDYPSQWRVTRTGINGAILAPEDGIQTSRNGDNVNRGILVDLFDISEGTFSLDQATNRLLVFLHQRNQALRLVPGAQAPIFIDGEPGLRTVMIGRSALTNAPEVVWIVTRVYYSSLFYLVFVAPEEEFPSFQPAFEKVIASVRFR